MSLPFTVFTSAKEIEATHRAALPIIAAAEKFRSEKGAYPAKIADPIPASIAAKPRVPIGVWGREYQLRQTFQGGFVLEFSEKLGQRWEYDSGPREWRKVIR